MVAALTHVGQPDPVKTDDIGQDEAQVQASDSVSSHQHSIASERQA